MRELCTTAQQNGKIIQRSEFKEYIDQNAKRVAANQELYKRRQAIVEHPFGTIKRQWEFDHVMTKKSRIRASADVGLIFIAYNLKRILNLTGKRVFRPYTVSFSLPRKASKPSFAFFGPHLYITLSPGTIGTYHEKGLFCYNLIYTAAYLAILSLATIYYSYP